MKAATPEAYKLLHDGAIALSRVEANGMRVDMDYLTRTISETKQEIKEREESIKKDKVYKTWFRRFGGKTNLGSKSQLGQIVFEELGYKRKHGSSLNDEGAFEGIELPFLKDYFAIEKLKKVSGTFLEGVRREAVDGYLHPFFNLNVARSYRGSSDSPNFQNYPVRNAEISKLIRSAFIARDNHVIVEIDYSGIEVRIAACYHKDPTMLTYIKDPTKDMHRDMAAQCYKTTPENVSKTMRYCAKNMFVFPEFYGDYYLNCAANMWEAISTLKLETAEGVPLKKHLKRKGITERGACDKQASGGPEPGTFEHHIQQVERDFWERRFPVYTAWKKRHFARYEKTLGFSTLTGFYFHGHLRRNEVINYPVQGSAFHCLLWSLIQLQNWLDKYDMRSVIVGQIHDSIVLDVHIDELEDVLHQATRIMTHKLPRHWKWINVPIEVEIEVSPPGKTWYDKKPYKMAG